MDNKPYRSDVKRLDTQYKDMAQRSWHQNILHNWDFKNPVNQRGQKVYTLTSGQYAIDRWKTYNFTGGSNKVELNDGFITFTPNGTNNGLQQLIEFPEKYRGLTLTLTVKIRNRGSVQGSTTIGQTDGNAVVIDIPANSEWATYKATGIIRNDTTLLSVIIWGRTGTILDVEMIKLELGTISTLANDPPMDYGRALAICQRYRLKLTRDDMYGDVGFGYAHSEHVVLVAISVPATMRTWPTVVWSGSFVLAEIGSTRGFIVTDMGIVEITPGMIRIVVSVPVGSGLILGRPYLLAVNNDPTASFILDVSL